MSARQFLRHLAHDERGSSMVEFAFVGPLLILMLLGVLQVGMAMQNYNALRNVSADVARYAMVQRQSGNMLSNSQIRVFALGHAQGVPYLLHASNMNAAVVTATSQRVTGARELTLTITYQVDSLLSFAGLDGPYISHTRPIFLMEVETT